MKKFITKIIIILFFIILPFLVLELLIINMNPIYNDSFSSALIDKVERLEDIDEQKIILVGGSSLPFGIDSELIEKHIGSEIVNFGLYANLGTKIMLDLSKININKEDIVIIAPELNEQTYSLYFNPIATLEAIEENILLSYDLPIGDQIKLFYNSYKFGLNKLSVDSNINLVEPYTRSAFNEYGDIKTERPYNNMPLLYDKSMMININDNLINNEFIDYINDYINYCKNKGAYVYFTFSPMNELAISDNSNYALFNKLIREKLDCEIMGNVEDFIYDSKYFYDTNFHLNDAGSVLHTKHIIELIKEMFNINTKTDIEIPEVKEKPGEDIVNGDNTYLDYFEYTMIGNNYYIESIKNEYKDVKKIIVPSTYDDIQIIGINTLAFKDCRLLEEIHINDNIKMLDMDMFIGCDTLTKIYIHVEKPSDIFVPSINLLTGASPLVKIYIQKEFMRRFQSDYTWSVYGHYFSEFEE